jgi:hypothetical protein
MGICQSSSLKVTVFNQEKNKAVYFFTMEKMRTAHTIGDVLKMVNIELGPHDKIYLETLDGVQEITAHSQFQLDKLVIKRV